MPLEKLTVPLTLLVTCACGQSASAEPIPALPNIVVFLSDDLGRAETTIHGSKEVRTPNIAELAKDGMTFNNAYVASPSCCPNRSSLLTGLMPARHGAHPNHSKVKPGTKFLLPLLKKQGYHIASFGKVAHGRGTHPGVDFYSPRPVGLAESVEKWFKTARPDGPTCLLVGDRRPHVTWTKESEYDPAKLTLPAHLIDTPETREHWARYLTDISGMDREMGRVRELAKDNLGDDCVFVFTSDHGPQWPLAKWNLYESGVRVPLIVSWPGKVKAGSRTDAMVSWVDILPTLLDVAGAEAPEGIDGRSFKGILTGDTKTHREKIFTTHTGDGAMNIFPIRAVRVGDMKYIHNLRPDAWHTTHIDQHPDRDGASAYWRSWQRLAKTDPEAAAKMKRYHTRPPEELYNLSKDPLETNNLADDPAFSATKKQLSAELGAWATAQGDDLKPHREPYPKSDPLPVVTKKPK